MFRKILASLVLATFLVGVSGCVVASRRHGRYGDGPSTAAITAAGGVIAIGLLGSLVRGLSSDKTTREVARLDAGLAHRAIGPGSVAVTTDDGFAHATVSGATDGVLLPEKPVGW